MEVKPKIKLIKNIGQLFVTSKTFQCYLPVSPVLCANNGLHTIQGRTQMIVTKLLLKFSFATLCFALLISDFTSLFSL